MPTEIRVPVTMVGAAAGRITVSAVRSEPSSCVRATLIQSSRTPATPKAVLMSMGQIEQMKMTKIAHASLSWMTKSASGIQACGEIGRSTWMTALSALQATGDMPIRKPSGMAGAAASV